MAMFVEEKPLISGERPDRLCGVELWWIDRPAGPRLSVRSALVAWVVFGGALLLVGSWIVSRAEQLWPWGVWPSPAQMLLRYLLIFGVYLAYVTLTSVSAWRRLAKTARADRERVPQLIADGQWKQAALSLHRYCLLRSAVIHRLPPKVAEWDQAIRPRLPKCRRLYIYYHRTPPAAPGNPEAAFSPEVLATGLSGWWSAGSILLLAGVVFTGLSGVWRLPIQQLLTDLNFLVACALFIGYGSAYAMRLLGKRCYIRFAPGLAQIMMFGIGRKQAKIETIDLRAMDTVLDLSGPRIGFSLIDAPANRLRDSFLLPKSPEIAEILLRAALSTAHVPELPTERLTD